MKIGIAIRGILEQLDVIDWSMAGVPFDAIHAAGLASVAAGDTLEAALIKHYHKDQSPESIGNIERAAIRTAAQSLRLLINLTEEKRITVDGQD